MINPASDFELLKDALQRVVAARGNLPMEIDHAKAVLKTVEMNEFFDKEKAERLRFEGLESTRRLANTIQEAQEQGPY